MNTTDLYQNEICRDVSERDRLISNKMSKTLSGILESALSDNTRKTYAKAWQDFTDYCNSFNLEPLSAGPDDVVNFLIEMATTPRSATGKVLSMGSISILQCAINRHFLNNEKQSPTNHPKVTAVLCGLQRLHGRPQRRVKALRETHIKAMIKECGNSLIGLRNAAILAVGFSAALRRSEICALNVDDISFCSEKEGGMVITIRKSKTDQGGMGQHVAIPEGRLIQPVKHLRKWLDAAKIDSGRIFRTMRRGGNLRGDRMHHSDIPRIVKAYAEKIGLNPKDYAGHSLRAGFVTSAAVHNARLDKIMEVTRHTNPQTLMKYIRDENRFNDHAGEKFL